MRDLIGRIAGRHASTADDHERILADIRRLLRVSSEEPALDDTDLMDRLVSAGVDRARAWRLVTFVPIAFGRSILDGLKVEAPSTYISRSRAGQDSQRQLRDQPEFRAAADHLRDLSQMPGFRALAVRGAEVNVLNQLMQAGSKPEDVTLAEVLTWELD